MVDTVNITVRDITVGDVLIPHWSGGKDVALDVTVTNSLQAATVTMAATTPGHAANEAHERKIREAAEECRQQGIVFVPLAAESLGGWHPVAVMELKRLASALARQSSCSEGILQCSPTECPVTPVPRPLEWSKPL